MSNKRRMGPARMRQASQARERHGQRVIFFCICIRTQAPSSQSPLGTPRFESTVPRCSEPSFCFAPGAQATARTRTRHVAQGPLRLARCTKATMYNGNKKTKSAREKGGRGCSVHTPLDPNLYQNAQLFLFRNQSPFRRSVFVDGGVKCSTTVPLDRTPGK